MVVCERSIIFIKQILKIVTSAILERFEVKAKLVAPILKDNQLFGLLIAHITVELVLGSSLKIDLFS